MVYSSFMCLIFDSYCISQMSNLILNRSICSNLYTEMYARISLLMVYLPKGFEVICTLVAPLVTFLDVITCLIFVLTEYHYFRSVLSSRCMLLINLGIFLVLGTRVFRLTLLD